MDSTNAQNAFAALAQPTRLAALRLLVKAGAQGMAAGDIAVALGAKPNTTSQNLSHLVNAGLLTNRREGRSIKYSADFTGIAALLHFLLEDCCGGSIEVCAPLIKDLTSCSTKGRC